MDPNHLADHLFLRISQYESQENSFCSFPRSLAHCPCLMMFSFGTRFYNGCASLFRVQSVRFLGTTNLFCKPAKHGGGSVGIGLTLIGQEP